MKKLACLVGRHAWTTIVEHGESYRTCATCGRSPRAAGKGAVSQTDLDYMKSSGESDSSISSGY